MSFRASSRRLLTGRGDPERSTHTRLGVVMVRPLISWKLRFGFSLWRPPFPSLVPGLKPMPTIKQRKFARFGNFLFGILEGPC